MELLWSNWDTVVLLITNIMAFFMQSPIKKV